MKLAYMAPALELYGSVTALTSSFVKCSPTPHDGGFTGHTNFEVTIPGQTPHGNGDTYDGRLLIHDTPGAVSHTHDPDGCDIWGVGF